MNQIPPDWNEDRTLWEALGRLPQQRPPSNFAYRVHQKLTEKPNAVHSWKLPGLLLPSLVSFGRGWAAALVAVAACLTLLFTWTHQPVAPSEGVVGLATDNSEVELAQLAQHYELIQDLEVIENLDEL